MPRADQIVVIMTDTQRFDMLGCYGSPGVHTPNLDRLASQGIRFDRAYTCQPVCGPARAALFTGTYPHSNGSWGNCMPLGANVTTIGQRLRDSAYHTAYIGKWHLDGGDYFGTGRCPDGWDPRYWYDMRNYLEQLSPEDRLRSRQPRTNDDPSLTADFTFGRRCANRAIDFLTQHGSERFCLVLSFDEPHDPHLCPRPFSTMFQDYRHPRRPNVWDTLKDKPAHQHAWSAGGTEVDRDSVEICMPDFFGCNAFVDDEIGRVVAAIDRHAPGALVIYTADHGDMLASHCLWGKGPAMYDEITRVPFIVRWPGVAPAGAACPHPVSHIDVAPTLMQAAGVPLPKLLEGRSLLPALASPSVRTNDAVFMEFARYEIDHDGFGGFQLIRCAFDGRYKLVVNLLTSDELYDLEADPYEMTNRIDDAGHAPARDALHDRLLAWMDETRDPFRGYYWERRPWRTNARPPSWRGNGMTRQRENDEYEPRQLDYGTGLEMTAAVRKK